MFSSKDFPPHAAFPKAGFTLIEMLVAITLGSSTMLTAVALVHQAFEHQSAVRQRVQQTNSFNRFVERFRRDVHAASEARATADGIELVSADGGLTTYVSTDSLITREHQQGGLRQREKVQLSPAATAVLEIQSDPLRALLTVEPVEHNTGSRPLSRHIVVAVGGLTEDYLKPDLKQSNSVEEQP